MTIHAASDDEWKASLDDSLTTPPALPSVETRDEEYDRERRWASFIGECRDFARSERDGWAAVLRAVAEAMKTQRQLWR